MGDDDLLTAREAEDFTGLRYGYLDQVRRMVKFCQEQHPDDMERSEEWRARSPPWVKVGNALRYRRGDLAPFMTNRAGANRNGVCGICRFYKHDSWEIGREWFNPDKAYCTWAESLPIPDDTPPWLRGALHQRVGAKGGRSCKVYEPAHNAQGDGGESGA